MASELDPVTDETLDALREEMADQRATVRKALAEDLGGTPEEYDAERRLGDVAGGPTTDGGE